MVEAFYHLYLAMHRYLLSRNAINSSPSLYTGSSTRVSLQQLEGSTLQGH